MDANTQGYPHSDADLDYENLSRLAYESQLIDPSDLPFHSLKPNEFRQTLNHPFTRYTRYGDGILEFGTKPRGNYVASLILSHLRIQARGNGVRFRDLQMVFTLPTELSILIFEHLHPIDLYNMIRAAKSLRSFLLNRNASSIWETCFLRHPDIPFYPSDVSAPKWSSLLFGPATCDECGYHNSMVDFTYRRRRCDTCQDTVYKDDDGPQAVVNAILGNDPDAPHDIWRLVRYTYRSNSFRYPELSDYVYDPKYSMQDVVKRAEEMKQLLLTPNVARDYQAFVTTTVAETREYVKHAKVCERWSYGIYFDFQADYLQMTPTFYDICRKRLVKLGHNPQDAKVASEDMDLWLRQMWDLTTTRKLNSKLFWKYLPKLEVMVADAKRDRLDRELQHRIRDRRDIVTAFYTKIVKAHFQPEVWEYLPVPHAIYDIDLFSDYIHNEQEVVGELPVKAARAAIRRLTDKWVSDKKRYLVEIMVMAGAASPEASPLAENCALDLAGAVFECPRGIGELELEYYCPTLVGWEDAGLHLYCYNDITEPLRITDHQARIQFSEVGYKSVLALLALLELDPRTTLARDLDTLNARFICTNCPLEYKNGMQGRHAMDWRECVSHAIRMRRRLTYDLHKLPAFAILSESVAVPIRAHESIHFNPTDLSWSCKHCAEHFESPVLRQTAVAHVKESHSIFKPTENIDFFYRRNKDSPTRKLYFVGQDADSNHLCMKCYHPKSLRLRIKDRLLWHLRDKHDCPNPVEGVDWVKVEIFEKTTEEPNNPLQDS